VGLPVVAILGRPNVGKSTLFNRLTRKREAIVDDNPGVTRDRNYSNVEWDGKEFILVDTGGVITDTDDQLAIDIRYQAEIAAREADLVLFIVENSINPEDREIARNLRKQSLPIFLVVNKTDNEKLELNAMDAWNLGLGEPIPISALNGRGVGDFLDKMVEKLPEEGKGQNLEGETRIAVIGKPNVGKSSLINTLLGKNKLLVSEIPGTTRDSIDTEIEYKDHKWLLTDTAGLLRKQYGVQYYSSLRTLSAIKRSDIVLLMADAVGGFSHQDKRIAAMAVDFYKGLVIAFNKWDLKERGPGVVEDFMKLFKVNNRFLDFVPIYRMSVLDNKGIERVLDGIEKVIEERKKRISTSELNSFIGSIIQKRPPSYQAGKRPNIMYVTQTQGDPPIFHFFCRGSKYIQDNYKKYLYNAIRAEYGFNGVSIKMVFRERR